jgi:signal transduction histidine kinase
MLRVYACITEQHDLRLVLLAGVICMLGCYTAVSMLARARAAEGQTRRVWLAAAAVVTGSGVWATHFIAMLAFHPNLPTSYDIDLTALSIVMAVGVTVLAYWLSLRRGVSSIIGGAVVGMAIGAMHYIGMAATQVPADIEYDPGMVVASLLIGIGFGAAALYVDRLQTTLLRRLTAAFLFTIAICGLHFTAMAATSLTPDPTITVPARVLAPGSLAIAIAAVTVLIVGLGLVGSVIDHHLAARLRAHVSELEATQRELEATTSSLRKALAAAAASSQAKSQFLAMMNHELRTPLNAVIGFAELMAGETFGPLGHARYREYVADIRNSGAHLLGLINSVLDFSKIEAGRMELTESAIDLDALLTGAMQMLRLQADEGGIAMTLEVEAGLPRLRADERLVRQVALNLLSNAVKFTPPGGSIRIRARRNSDALLVTIADTGIGIASDDIPKALDRFGQVDNSLSRRYEGTGLGLPLAKRLVELHGGTLAIQSDGADAGTTVTIAFPLQRIVSDGDGRRAA